MKTQPQGGREGGREGGSGVVMTPLLIYLPGKKTAALSVGDQASVRAVIRQVGREKGREGRREGGREG